MLRHTDAEYKAFQGERRQGMEGGEGKGTETKGDGAREGKGPVLTDAEALVIVLTFSSQLKRILRKFARGLRENAGRSRKDRTERDITPQELMDVVLGGYKFSGENRCPHCGRTDPGYHCVYTRIVTDYIDGKVVDCELATRIVRCEACGHYSVVLNSLVIPYCRHSLRFVLLVLADFFSGMKIDDICRKYCITAPTVYRWRDRFMEDKALWKKALDQAGEDAMEFIAMIAESVEEEPAYGEAGFLRQFMESSDARLSFMQRHRNAYSHQHA